MLHATPYDINYAGFYFSSIDELNALYEQHVCEEFEIQFTDGDNLKLFSSAQIKQCNLYVWFEDLVDIADDDNQAIQISYLLYLGYKLTDALSKLDEVCLFLGSAQDYAYELFNECYDIPEYLACCVDYENIANDMLINSEIIEYSDTTFIINSFDF